MAKKTEKNKQNEQEEAGAKKGGVVGYVVGGVVGLLILVVAAALLRETSPQYADELPHLTILAEFDDLSDPATRKALCDLQRDLVKLEIAVTGPLNYPPLVPVEGGIPFLKNIDELTKEELAAAKPYFPVAQWLSPRIYSMDLKSAILRAAPKNRGRFLPGTAQEINALLAKHKAAFTGLWPYSHDLGLEEPEARSRTNVVFGVQVAHLSVRGTDGALASAENVMKLERNIQAFQHPEVRSCAGQGAWYSYAQAVILGLRTVEGVTVTQEQMEYLKKLGREGNIPSLIDAQDANGMIEVFTTAEGKANHDVCWAVNAHVAKDWPNNVVTSVPRKRR